MPSEVGAPKQHKQPSRKGKRAWRKNVDITEVQDGLETLREEIIQTGTVPVAEQISEKLFAVDIVGSEDVRRKLKSSKPLKVDEILGKRSAVPALDSRKRSGLPIGDGILEPASKRQKIDWVSKKEVARLRQAINTINHLQSEHLDTDDQKPGFDLWGEGNKSTSQSAKPDLAYIPKPKAKVAPSTLKAAPIPMTASGQATSAVRDPDAGTSYNPDFEQWDALLRREGAKEVVAEQARLAKEAADAERQARIDALSRDKGYNTEDESVWEGFETDRSESAATSEALKAKRPQRKTPAQRNKIQRRKEAERLAKHEAKMGTKQNRILDMIMSKVGKGVISAATEDQLGNAAAVVAALEGDDEIKIRRRRLGPAAIPRQNLELVLPDELQESLRQLKPEGNLLQDRYRNLLINGKIESRKPIVQPRKKRVKMTEKWSYKDFGVSV